MITDGEVARLLFLIKENLENNHTVSAYNCIKKLEVYLGQCTHGVGNGKLE